MIPPIFISHSHYDNGACRALVQFLQEQFPGIDIFYDESNLHGGDDWIARIQREVIARPYFIVVLSRHSVVAEWVREETNLALSRAVADKAHRKIIPLQVDDGLQLADIDQLAPLLTMRQIVNLAPGAPTSARDDLLRVLRGESSGEAPRVDPAQLADLERARDLANQTQDDVAEERWYDAVAHGKRAVSMPGNERDAALWGDLGLAYLRTAQLVQANATLRTALSFNKYRSDLWRLRAQALAQQGQFDGDDGAINAWEEAETWTGAPAEKLVIFAEWADALIAARRWTDANQVVLRALPRAQGDPAWQARQRAVTDGPLTEQRAREDAERRVREEEARRQEAARLAEQQRQEQARQEKLLPPRLRALNFTLFPGKDVIVPPTVVVPATTFNMGGDKDSYYGTSRATVQIAAFRIGAYPVTVAEWACAVAAKAVPEPSGWATQQQHPDHPVVNISWLDVVQRYLPWFNGQTGQTWRLPTEAEWEYAARGTDGRIFPWGNQWDKSRANTNDGGPGTTTPVGAYSDKGDAGPFGTHDQAGNVWEWTSTLWREDKPYDASAEKDADTSSPRVLRGGSWGITPRNARAASRYRDYPLNFNNLIGARLVLARAGAGI